LYVARTIYSMTLRQGGPSTDWRAPPPAAVKNKFVQALVVMFKLEYPDEWPSFFSDLFMLLKSSGCTPFSTYALPQLPPHPAMVF